MLETIVFAMIAAVMYAGSQFVKKWPGDNPEDFDWYKFGATVILGGLIGIAVALKGDVVDQTNVELQIFLFAGATAIIENSIKIVVRFIRKYINAK